MSWPHLLVHILMTIILYNNCLLLLCIHVCVSANKIIQSMNPNQNHPGFLHCCYEDSSKVDDLLGSVVEFEVLQKDRITSY